MFSFSKYNFRKKWQALRVLLLHFSSISSVLNGSAAIAWSDVIKPFVKVTDTTATKISKVLGKLACLQLKLDGPRQSSLL